jgi:hypothetical protein
MVYVMEFWHSLRREENCIRDIPLALDERKKLN